MTVKKNPCSYCNSSDNLITFEDGGSYCYTPDCEYNSQNKTKGENKSADLIEGTYSCIPNRRISQRTCEFFSYQLGIVYNQPCHIANYRDASGKLVAQKLRLKDKRFEWRGNAKQTLLFGQHLWSNTSNYIIITEGEIDCLSIAEVQDCKWPVVSLPNGASSASKAIKQNLEWLSGFKQIILCFDMDEAGKTAIGTVVGLFPPGKIRIASLSRKDANEVLLAGNGVELTKLVWNAAEYRPDGIIWGSEITADELYTQKPRGLSLPYPILDRKIRGLKSGRIYTIYAGTGCGKSTLMREIALHIRKTSPQYLIGNIFLEESLSFTALSYIAMEQNIPAYQVEEDPNILSETQRVTGLELIKDMAFYRHFGSLNSKYLFNLLDYLVIGKGIKVIMLDHISLLISGMVGESGEGERKDIDILMTNLRSFCERTQAIIICATQLKRKKGSYSEGEEITESDSRGSGAIEHISDVIFSLNCDTRGDHPNNAVIRIIKNRITGERGETDTICYNNQTGRYLPIPVHDSLSNEVL